MSRRSVRRSRSIERRVVHKPLTTRSKLPRDLRTHRIPRKKVIHVKVNVPVSVAKDLDRTVHYSYPRQRQLNTRVLRTILKSPREKFVPRKFSVVVPKKLPYVKGSYVTAHNRMSSAKLGRSWNILPSPVLSVHSKRQYRKLMEREYNRKRYSEHKSNGRKARNGQLESVRSDRLGLIGFAVARGYGMRKIADAALVSRALGG